MEAGSPLRQRIATLAAALTLLLAPTVVSAANFRTQNFLVHAPTAELAKAVGEAAEKYRDDLANHWLGGPLRPWPTPCPVRVIAGPNLAAQGVTTYNRSPVRDFQMEVVGTPERILDSVLPHEVSHTVLATYFGRPLPRWADEGICTTVEHESERNKHEAKLREFLQTRRGIAMNQLFLLTEYPNDVLPMYAQGYSVCRFLIEQQGPQTFIQFLKDYMEHPSWTDNVRKHYQYESLAELQEYWLAWVGAGSGPVAQYAKVQPASAQPASAVATAGGAASPGPATLALNAPTRSNPIAGDRLQAIQQAGGLPANAGTQLNSPIQPAAATALASTAGDGWYQRKRLEAQSKDPALAAAPTAANPMVPPSIRDSGRYSSAQPQPEQQLSRGGTVIDPIPYDGNVLRRFR